MVIEIAQRGLRTKLGDLLNGDLAFRNGDKGQSLHTLHAFAARFPPQLPKSFIEALSSPGEIVLDPMAGSGATLVEAWLTRRNAVGVDMDPLAVRLCKAKTTWVDPDRVRDAGQRALESWLWTGVADPLSAFRSKTDKATLEFIDYWFKIETQRELSQILTAIQMEPDPKMRTLLEVVFSSVIITKSGGVSMARDLAHTRPHLVEDKVPKSALRTFQVQLGTAAQALEAVRDSPKGCSVVLAADARQLPLGSDSVDLIVTSPPYANALDYVRANKFSLAWLGNPIPRLRELRGRYIGAERVKDVADVQVPLDVTATVDRLASLDGHKAKVLDKYFKDMSLALAEMLRVLRPGRAAVLVVGPSTMRGLPIETHTNLASIAGSVGFEVVAVVKRSLDRDRRMMPARLGNNGNSQIEVRIYEEYVIGLLKREKCKS